MGFNRTGIYDEKSQRSIMNVSGKIKLNGNMSLGAGSRLEVGKNGTLVIGGNVANSAGVTICCHDRIEIGGNTVISWDTLIIDKDFHYIMDTLTGKTRTDHKPIYIGEGAWLCAGSKVMKGSVLPDGCILAAGAILNRIMDEKDCLLMGNPAHVVKPGVKRSDIELIE